MKRFCHRLALAFCTLVTLCAVADTGVLFTPDRMSSSLITCMCQDRYGFIWMGTEYGLNKFDGYRFTPYLFDRSDTTSIIDNEISSLFVDGDGQLWVGCAKGLVRYDYEHDSFQRYHFPDQLEPRINSMAQSRDGKLLLGTAGYGLYSMKRGTAQIDYESDFNQRRADHFYSRIHIDREGNLWRSSHVATLTKFTLRDGRMTSLRDYQSTCGQPMSYVEYSKDELLIVCMYGILSYRYSTGELSEADFDLSALDPNVSIKRAFMTHRGNLLLATTGSGVITLTSTVEVRGTRCEVRRHTQHPTPNTQHPTLNPRHSTLNPQHSTLIDLTTADIVDAMEDKDHNLWVACYGRGLLMMNKEKEAFQNWSFAEQNYRTGGSVASIAEGEQGDIWCTVQNNGVFRFNSEGRITAHPESPVGTRLIYRDRTGQYWLTTENVLYQYNPQTGRWLAIQGFSGRGLNCMADDADGRLYVSVYGLGMYIYDTKTHQGETVSMQQTDRKGGYLCNDWIKSLQFDSQGLLWIATVNGLSVMDPKTSSFNSLGWSVLLEGKQCFSTCETKDGDMLIGTDSGLYVFRRKQKKVEEAANADLLRERQIGSMVRDEQGDIWISTSHGIWQYRNSDGQFNVNVNDNVNDNDNVNTQHPTPN
ncbi:MAG: hybrid sensor histidine kinase/response regulator, partial [Prevotella sp.]|nr:hybrid sensor histidine kinase/response regulator [Prevotella sp.]